MFDPAFVPCQSIPSQPYCPHHQGISLHQKLQYHAIPQSQMHKTKPSTVHLPGVYYSPRHLTTTSLWTYLDQQDISFLKINQFEMPYKSAHVVRKVTKAYVESDIRNTQGDITIEQVLDAIDAEYKWSSVPFSLGGRLFELKRRQDESMKISFQVFSKIITFAAINHLPKDMAILLFGGLEESSRFTSQTKEHLQQLIATFVEDRSWTCNVEFPQGLSLMLKRRFVASKREKYNPLPRKSFLSTRNDALEAKQVLKEADSIKPPIKLAKKEDIERIAENLSLKSGFASEGEIMLKDSMLTFFPKENQFLVGLRRIMSTQKSRQLKDASIASLVSYVLITVLWYTLSIVWTWRTRHGMGSSVAVMGGEMQSFSRSLKTLGAILGKVRTRSRITQIPRWSLAVLLSPLGKKLLQRVEKRFQVSTTSAIRIVVTYLVGACMGLLSLLIMFDAILSSSPTRNHILCHCPF